MAIDADTIDRSDVKAEVEAVFAAYEVALVDNDIAALDAFFHADARTIRYGVAENLYGIEAIRRYRAALPNVRMTDRRLAETVITSYGPDMAIAMTLFARAATPGRVGRQSQTWVRFPDGWKIVAAHVSEIAAPADEGTSEAPPDQGACASRT